MTSHAEPGLPIPQSTDPETAFEDYNLQRPLSAMVITHGWEKEPHAHRRGQLLLSVKGLITCEVASGLWLVPSQNALWIPPGKIHDMHCVGEVEIYLIFMDAALIGALPGQCCTLAISPLLRELIRAVAHLPPLYDEAGPPAPLIQTMLNELATAPVERLHLPMPEDARLRRITDGWADNPADRTGPGAWAQRVGMSERSLSRLILHETGMSFLRWRQQFQIMQALDRLSRGVSVQHIAYDLGYESPSAFIAMFRKILGTSPSRYLARSEKYLPRPG